MGFNADAYLEAFTPPAITIGGEEYVGKLLSFDEVVEFMPLLERIDSGEASLADTRDLTRDVCTAIGIPADKVLALPPTVALEAIKGFFECSTNPAAPSPAPPTAGDPTASPPAEQEATS